MKKQFINIALLSIVLLLNACQQEQFESNGNTSSSNVEVVFTSQIISRVVDDKWETNDGIGVFMLNHGGSLSDESIVNNAINMKYVYGEDAMFKAATEADRMFYPSKGAVDFIAYHPYRSVENYVLEMDITRQQDQSAIDLLYSNNLQNVQATEDAQNLHFNHQLSQLVFKIRAGEGLEEEDLKDINVFVKDIPTRASFALTDAQLTPDNETNKDVSAFMQGNDAMFIVFPGESRNKEIVAILPSGEHNFRISNEDDVWQSGYKYTYTLVLNKNNSSPALKATIGPWKEEDRGEPDHIEDEFIALPWDGSSDCTWYNDTDTEFELTTASDLSGLAELVNAGNTFEGKTIVMARDLDLNNLPFAPIGSSEHPFAGTFDGQQNKIVGYNPQLTDDVPTPMVALFGVNEGTIGNLTVIGSGTVNYRTAEAKPIVVGSIVGTNKGTVEGCCSYVKTKLVVDVSAKLETALGGIVGVNQGKISDCRNYGVLDYFTDNKTTTAFVGGIVGLLKEDGIISQCTNYQNLKTQGTTVAMGGICGERGANKSTESEVKVQIVSCSNNGDVIIEADGVKGYVGGIIGQVNDWSTITSCTNSGNISSSSLVADSAVYAGGIAGRVGRCVLKGHYNRGNVSASSASPNAYAGGIVGYLSVDSELHTSTHATEATTESSSTKYRGGLVGYKSIKERVFVYGCNNNLGNPRKWIGSASGNDLKGEVDMNGHDD